MNIISSFSRHILHPLNALRTGDLATYRYLADYERTQYLSHEEIARLQMERLSRLLHHAVNTCPFYAQHYSGIDVASIRTQSEILKIPPISKGDIQSSRDQMISKNWRSTDLIPNQTGGSTGTPISFFLTHDRTCSRRAATWRHNRWAGYETGDRVALLWGAGRDLPKRSLAQSIKDYLLSPTLALNTSHITEARLKTFLYEIKRFRPKIMLSYAKSAVLFARFIKAYNFEPYQFSSIITSAEVLESSERRLLEETFGCRVFDRYGCREVSVIASECSEHDGMHVMAEGLLVEVARRTNDAEADQPGPILVTDLLNFGMPLIRYQIGDMGSLTTDRCSCGRGLPRLKSIAGRVTDFLVGSDGRLVSGAALTVTVVAKRPSLGQVQIIQQLPGQLLFRIAPKNDVPISQLDFEFLRKESRSYLGSPLQIDFEIVERIEPEASGKYLFSKSTAQLPF